MEGGYINEGGQLKSKNGQKYIINQRRDGFYVTKSHAILIAALIAVVMAVFAVLMYFLFAQSCTAASENEAPSKLVGASFVPLTPESPPIRVPKKVKPGVPNIESADISSRAIQLNEGWSPILYTLIMQPHIANGTSNGHVVIDIVKDADAKDWPSIVLDINNITITKAQVFQSNETLAWPVEITTSYGENNETFIIKLEKLPVNDTLQVDLKFISQLSNTLQGFYRVGYNDKNSDTKKWLVSTQFSPIDARRAFPCFDRPDKKARFKISLIREEKRAMALSNMPSIYTSHSHPGYIREDFDVTPKMSTYLVAFMVTDLVQTNASKSALNNTHLPQINFWSRKEVSDMTQFGYDFTSEILPLFEKYFDIRFKLPKIDMVAVPEFGFSAMENWGLITFRESALLVPTDDENRSSAEHSEHVASIIAHELAHQWFGNLVTMKWWDDLWLKEGFATFMSYVALSEIKPNWRYMDFFSINELQQAMAADSDTTSHAISFKVSDAKDIRRIFDPISYSKGASIIRMVQSFLGEDTFKDALRKYLSVFEYSNAMHDDLWDVLTEFGHQYNTLPIDITVKAIMDSWTLQAGYPILTVVRNGSNIHVSQQRYLLPTVDGNDSQRWHIPITYVTQADPTHTSAVPQAWLTSSDNLTLANVVDPDHWFYFNVRRSGYYRVNYDYNTWLIVIRNSEYMPNITKAQLIDDALSLARAEAVSYDIPLTFILKLGASDILPWAAATSGIEYLTNMLNREPAYEHFRALMRYVIKPIYTEMGFNELPGESHVNLMHRALIVHHACYFGHDWCVNYAQRTFRDWMADKTKNLISPNLKGVIYCTALREGSFEEWYFAYNRYMETTSASEKELILDALGCTTKTWLLSKYLNMTITSTSGIRKQDGRRAFIAVAKNNLGFEIAFDFLMTNIKEISEYFGDGFSTLSKMVDSVTTYMNKDYHLEQLQQFQAKAESIGLKSVGSSIQLAVKKVQNNVYWRSHAYYKLEGFLSTLTRDLHINLY